MPVWLIYTSRGHGCGFLAADFLPIAALLKQILSLYAPISAPRYQALGRLALDKNQLTIQPHPWPREVYLDYGYANDKYLVIFHISPAQFAPLI